jgi:hypothetical protein
MMGSCGLAAAAAPAGAVLSPRLTVADTDNRFRLTLIFGSPPASRGTRYTGKNVNGINRSINQAIDTNTHTQNG